MTTDLFLEAIGTIDDIIILDAKSCQVLSEVKIKSKHWMTVLVAAILVALLVTTALAINFGWHIKLIEYFNASEEQMESLDMAIGMPEATVTHNGVTITVKQTLADAFGIYVVYEMTVPDNIELDDNVLWAFTVFSVPSAETEDYVSVSTIGTTILEQNGNKRTVLLHKQVSSPFTNGKIELIFQNLIYFVLNDKSRPYMPLVEGEWELEWDFTYVDTGKTIELNLPLSIDGSDNTISKLVVSPMSICAFVTGDTIVGSVQPIVNFKDGSSITYSSQDNNASFSVYLSDAENEIFVNQLYYRFERIIELTDVASMQIGDVVISVNGLPTHNNSDGTISDATMPLKEYETIINVPSPVVKPVAIAYGERQVFDITLRIGESVSLNALVELPDPRHDNVVVWNSSNQSIFDVKATNESGTEANVTAISRGTATLTVAQGDIQTRCTVSVGQNDSGTEDNDAIISSPLHFTWPVPGYRNIVVAFGIRLHPVEHIYISHNGIDISAPLKSAVEASEAGTVVDIGEAEEDGYFVKLDHGFGIQTIYSNLQGHTEGLAVGDMVRKCDIIGYVGNTENEEVPHLHFGMMVNERDTNPMKYF